MILVVSFNELENSLFEKVVSDLGISHICRYINHQSISDVNKLVTALDDPTGALPRVIVLNLDCQNADWKALLTDLKKDAVWRFVPVLGFGFLDDPEVVNSFYSLGGTSCVQKPHGYDDLTSITEATLRYWFDFSYLPCDVLTDPA